LLFLTGWAEVKVRQVQNYIKMVERHRKLSDMIMGSFTEGSLNMNEMSIKQFTTVSHKHKKSPAQIATFTKPDNGYTAGLSQRQH